MSGAPRFRPSPRRPSALSARAFEDLRFIRSTMERAASFTAVPGWGGVCMGVVALAATPVAGSAATPASWLATWVTAAVLAALVGGLEMARKLAVHRTVLIGGLRAPGWRFVASLVPGLFAGVCLTVALWRAGSAELLPGTWLLCYGLAVVAAGAVSIPPVKGMGLAFLALGAAALIAPASWGDLFMAAGFGGLQVGFGAWIARRSRG
jgi:hypothetical protein